MEMRRAISSVVEIGDGVAVLDAQEAVDGAGGVEEGAGEGRLAGLAVAGEDYITDLFGAVDLHGHTS